MISRYIPPQYHLICCFILHTNLPVPKGLHIVSLQTHLLASVSTNFPVAGFKSSMIMPILDGSVIDVLFPFVG